MEKFRGYTRGGTFHPAVDHDTTEYPIEINIIKVCPDCDGTGEVDVMGQVYPGEPHYALIDTRPCHCQLDCQLESGE